MNSLTRFFKSKSAPGIVLCSAAVLAMILVNSPLHWLYDAFLKIPVVFQAGDFIIDKALLLWINDGLMAIFFLLIGLEIKREILEGHLSKRDYITLPAISALGGLVLPALIYSLINWGDSQLMKGWAIPAATDIAFALGVLIILGDRIPVALKVCLVAIAIIDDLAAIVIIALFYTAETSLISLGLAAVGLSIAISMNKKGVTGLGGYILLGFFIWGCVLKSGVHATLAGVALGLIIPLRTSSPDIASPLRELEHTLHPFVSFFVLPIFAFANAGVSFASVTGNILFHPVTLGVMFGLFFGKQLGVMLFAFVGTKLKICKIPEGVNWLQFYGMALLTGIGFTMSLFIGSLAFLDPELVTAVRIGVLAGSFLSVVAGVMVLLHATKKTNSNGTA